MAISSVDIKGLLDDKEISESEKISKLAAWMLRDPGNFFRAVSERSLGKVRLRTLENLALKMTLQTGVEEASIPGRFLVLVLQNMQK